MSRDLKGGGGGEGKTKKTSANGVRSQNQRKQEVRRGLPCKDRAEIFRCVHGEFRFSKSMVQMAQQTLACHCVKEQVWGGRATEANASPSLLSYI